MSNNGRGAGLGRGTPHLLLLPARQKDAYTEPVLWDWGDRSLTAPSPTQPRRLGLHEERAGWEVIQAEEGSEPGMHAVWPLAVRWEVAFRCSPQGIHTLKSIGKWT